MIAVPARKYFARSRNSGNSAVTSRFDLDWSRTLPLSTKVTVRMPSHLISNSQFGSEKGLSPSFARVTETSLGMGALCAPGNVAGLRGAAPRLELLDFFFGRGR